MKSARWMAVTLLIAIAMRICAPEASAQSPPAVDVNAAGPSSDNVQPIFSAPQAGEMPAEQATAPAEPPAQIFENAQILARIGSETILASDVVPLAEEALRQKLNELPEEQRGAIPADQYEKLKGQFTKALLDQLIDVKIRYADAVANIPKENLPRIKSSINESFDQGVVKKLMEKYQVTTRKDLDEKMAAAGLSLDRQRQMFLERSLASGWESQHIKENRVIPVSELLGYYQQHIAEFEYPSKARWEELMVDFDRFNSKDEAYRALAEMGNEVLRGAEFAAVAQGRSHGPTRFQGGAYDWTTKGSLVSKAIDEAIFGLPIGRMSQIIEDEQGFHIVRVLERVEAGCVTFRDAQPDIRKKLHEQDLDRQRKEFLAKMKERTPVWSVFDAADGTGGPNSAAADSAFSNRPTDARR